jgi:hypothetical protein
VSPSSWTTLREEDDEAAVAARSSLETMLDPQPGEASREKRRITSESRRAVPNSRALLRLPLRSPKRGSGRSTFGAICWYG